MKIYATLLILAPTLFFVSSTLIEYFSSGFDWQKTVKSMIGFAVLAGMLSLSMVPGALSILEWFHIYEDRIEARGIFGCKNKVIYKNVEYVEETMIHINSYETRLYYIFHDGRKMYRGGHLNRNTFLNHKKYMLRIPKTLETENYILNTLHLEIRQAKTQCAPSEN